MSSSRLPNKRPVGRPKKQFSCEELDCLLERNHDFNALLTSFEKCNKMVVNLIITERTVVAISRYPVKGLLNEGSKKSKSTTC